MPRTPGKAINWLALRTAYVVRRLSAQECADEFRVNVTTVKKRAASEGWTAERNRNATAGAEVVAEEMRAAAVAETRVHASRVDRALHLGDALLARLERAIAAIAETDHKALRSLTESYRSYFDALSRGVGADRTVRGIANGRPSDVGADFDRLPTVIRFEVDYGAAGPLPTGTDGVDPYGPE